MTPTNALTQAGLNLIQQALTIYDNDLRLAVCNRRFAEMFDLPKAHTTPGATFEDTIRHLATRGEYGEIDDIEDFVRTRVDIARAFEPHYMERTRANGRTISVEGAPLPQGGWVTVYTDITDVKAQEQLLRTRSALLSEEVLARSEELSATNRKLAATISALEEAQRELREIEARTRLTTEMMPAHIAHVNADGIYTYSNRRLNAVMPGRPSQIVGLHITDALGQAAYTSVAPHLEAAFGGQQSTFEFTDDVSSRRIRVAFTPDEADKGVYILSMDVTEETQSRAALQQTRRRTMAAQLTSGLAHDFSNLLTIILGMQSKLDPMVQDPDAKSLIRATRQAALRGGGLLDRIAQMTGPRSFRAVPVNIAPFLADLSLLASPSLPSEVTLQVEDDTSGPYLLDPGMLQDSLLNLILNARDACAPRGAITVAVSDVMDTWLDIHVRDTGPGFSETALQRGLDPFFTTKGSKGTGLGLSMVYDSTKLAGGQVFLANTPTGAEVTLRLPLRRAVSETAAGLILLVEDEPELRATVRDMLTTLGHAVIEASTAAEAHMLASNLPDISHILSDIVLEGESSGVDLAQGLAPRPVTLMTSLPQDHPLLQRAEALGPVLRKPFGTGQLAQGLAKGVNN